MTIEKAEFAGSTTDFFPGLPIIAALSFLGDYTILQVPPPNNPFLNKGGIVKDFEIQDL